MLVKFCASEISDDLNNLLIHTHINLAPHLVLVI